MSSQLKLRDQFI